jgi:hypothetical protein
MTRNKIQEQLQMTTTEITALLYLAKNVAPGKPIPPEVVAEFNALCVPDTSTKQYLHGKGFIAPTGEWTFVLTEQGKIVAEQLEAAAA